MSIDNGFESEQSKELLTQQFVEKIAKADGQFIPVTGIKSGLGESIFISSRLGTDEVNPSIRYLNIDIFALREDKYLPVGMYDWEIRGDQANGNKQRHGLSGTVDQELQIEDTNWMTSESFHIRSDNFLKYATQNGGFDGMTKLRKTGIIDNEGKWSESIYRGKGLGSLLITTSAIVLEKHGVKNMDLGSLSDNAKRAWLSYNRDDRINLNPSEITKHPKSKEIIKKALST